MNKCVIFDLDGTLINSLLDIYENLNKALEKFGFSKVSIEKTKEFIGHGAKKLVKDAIGKPVTDDILEQTLDYYNEIYTNSGSPNTALFDGVKETLIELKKRGYMLAVCTNKPQQTADVIAQKLFSGLIDLVYGGKEGRALKPDPNAVVPLLKEFNAQAENAYMIGDMVTDVNTANNAKINCVAVLWGYGKEQDLISNGAKMFANKPSDLLEILK